MPATRELLQRRMADAPAQTGFKALRPAPHWEIQSDFQRLVLSGDGNLFRLRDGCQLWYMEVTSAMQQLMNGLKRTTRGDEGESAGGVLLSTTSKVRRATAGYPGDTLPCESNYGDSCRIHCEGVLQ